MAGCKGLSGTKLIAHSDTGGEERREEERVGEEKRGEEGRGEERRGSRAKKREYEGGKGWRG